MRERRGGERLQRGYMLALNRRCERALIQREATKADKNVFESMANERSQSRSNAPLIHFPPGCLRRAGHLLGGGALSLLGQSQRIRKGSEFKRGAARNARTGRRGQH